LNERLKTWRQALEVYDFCLLRSKTKYMECNFSKRSSSTLNVKIEDHIIYQEAYFVKITNIHILLILIKIKN